MRKIIVGSFITLDGVMQAAGGPEEDFEYGGWSVPYYDERPIKLQKTKATCEGPSFGKENF